jgi:hypothetical protein
MHFKERSGGLCKAWLKWVCDMGSVVKAKDLELFLLRAFEAQCSIDPNRQIELDGALTRFCEAHTTMTPKKTEKDLTACANVIRQKKGVLVTGSAEYNLVIALLKFHHRRDDMIPSLTGLMVDGSVHSRTTNCLYVQKGEQAPEQFSLKKCAAAVVADTMRALIEVDEVVDADVMRAIKEV